ncbi:CAF17-like 4Fe-4S cluster assembly/insertion protein YgfZ [Allorhodopirellula heiligendammensis]|uniref:Global regulator n=1 Tax=Allorhodopirellula heiligendammensis TaxID=2714739 RepID=A0A5C6BV66_9BACT|nr:aminomethyltransferase [Allorhodopirellula heiligendammensis]TWU15935.1 putative global regulator [Allorhodopirellula heiligendammensis]
MSINSTNTPLLLRLPSLSVLDLVGKDAAAILHNLTTNEIKSLEIGGPGVETFVTNVKGKCIGHVMAFRSEQGYRLIGAPGQSEAIAAQMDRYTIREEAEPQIVDDNVHAYLVVGSLAGEELGFQDLGDQAGSLPTYRVPWVDTPQGRRGLLLLAPTTTSLSGADIAGKLLLNAIVDKAEKDPQIERDQAMEVFHDLRVTAGYPWYGTDFNDSHLPQEVNRETETISFTKGCYLGQETIARLDALGQVQKKLVLWSSEDLTGEPLPAVDTKLFAGGEKAVGRLTSVARELPWGGTSDHVETREGARGGRVLALGFARRSHFEVGSEASGAVADKTFVARVERT